MSKNICFRERERKRKRERDFYKTTRKIIKQENNKLDIGDENENVQYFLFLILVAYFPRSSTETVSVAFNLSIPKKNKKKKVEKHSFCHLIFRFNRDDERVAQLESPHSILLGPAVKKWQQNRRLFYGIIIYMVKLTKFETQNVITC